MAKVENFDKGHILWMRRLKGIFSRRIQPYLGKQGDRRKVFTLFRCAAQLPQKLGRLTDRLAEPDHQAGYRPRHRAAHTLLAAPNYYDWIESGTTCCSPGNLLAGGISEAGETACQRERWIDCEGYIGGGRRAARRIIKIRHPVLPSLSCRGACPASSY